MQRKRSKLQAMDSTQSPRGRGGSATAREGMCSRRRENQLPFRRLMIARSRIYMGGSRNGSDVLICTKAGACSSDTHTYC